MIFLHPTVTHNQSALLRLQLRTGMRIVMGQCYLRLINKDGTPPASKPAKAKTETRFSNDWDGGSAA